MKLYLFGAILGVTSCSSLDSRPSSDSPIPMASPRQVDQMPLNIEVAGWVAYQHDGDNFIHLWSPGAPKSVFVIRESDAPPGFLDSLESAVPMDRRIRVTLTNYGHVEEVATAVGSAEIPSQVHWRAGTGYPIAPDRR